MICYLDSIRLSHSIAYSIDERYENKRYENETHFRNSVYYNCVLNLFEIVIHCIHSYPQTLSYIIWKYSGTSQQRTSQVLPIGVCYAKVSAMKRLISIKNQQLAQKIGVCYREVSAIKHVRYKDVSLYHPSAIKSKTIRIIVPRS